MSTQNNQPNSKRAARDDLRARVESRQNVAERANPYNPGVNVMRDGLRVRGGALDITRGSANPLGKFLNASPYLAAPTEHERGQQRRRAVAGGYKGAGIRDWLRARKDVQSAQQIPREGTKEFAQWVQSPAGRDLIETYGDYDQRQLFTGAGPRNWVKRIGLNMAAKGVPFTGAFVAPAQQRAVEAAQQGQAKFRDGTMDAVKRYAPLVGGVGLLGAGAYLMSRGNRKGGGAPQPAQHGPSLSQQAFRLGDTTAPGGGADLRQQAFRTGYTRGGSNV